MINNENWLTAINIGYLAMAIAALAVAILVYSQTKLVGKNGKKSKK